MTPHWTHRSSIAPWRGASAWLVIGLAVVACTEGRVVSDDGESEGTDSSGTSGVLTTTLETTGSTEVADDSGTSGGTTGSTTGASSECSADEPCLLDVLFVIDNSGTMGEEQLVLAGGFRDLVDELQAVQDPAGSPLVFDINIMVTTTDVGHPLCTAFQPADYTPQHGAPVYSGCNSRIGRFTGIGPSPVVIPEACTDNCPADVAPEDHFINFGPNGSNVPGDDPGAALACIGPQGIDGCGYEAPLEAMLQALNESACWNDPTQEGCAADPEWAGVTEGFLRDGSVIAVVMATDELDCSVASPNGYSYFTDIENPIYWNVNPSLGVPQATSAVCFNAGVSCTDANGDDVYEDCVAVDNEVLHSTQRYTDYLEHLSSSGHEVLMVGLLGVPPVAAHNPEPPFEPTVGGTLDLVYRNWIDAPYPSGDIEQQQWDFGERAADQIFRYGALGPGCTAADPSGDIMAQGLPPVRIREVCESLDRVDEEGNTRVRCCIESICDDDFAPAFRCITGNLGQDSIAL